MKIVILAGGGGTRLWPYSRQDKPKQFIPLLNHKTLFEGAMVHFKKYPRKDIYFSVAKDCEEWVKKFLPKSQHKNIIVEPEKRDTGPAMGFAAAYLSIKFPNEPMAFIPSDHYIINSNRFVESLELADKLIKKTHKMLDIAIHPTFPSTVLGYTKIGKKYLDSNGIEVYHFAGHKEKPPFNLAKKYVASGDYLWHANFYMWTPAKFLEAFQKYSPKAYKSLMVIREAIIQKDSKIVESEFKKIEKNSIDYMITEKMKASDVLIIKGDFGWSDVGAWDVIYNQMQGQVDQDRNLIKASWLGENTSGCVIIGDKKKLITTIGLEDIVVVDTDDALLICPKSKSQEVKKIVAKLKIKKSYKKFL